MKIFISILLILGATYAYNAEDTITFLDDYPNIQWVYDTSMNGTNYIVEELHSFELNKVRAKLTSYTPHAPAFDMLFDYNEGYMLFYYNLTGGCRILDLEKKDLSTYYKNILKDHTEYAGKRGHLDLFEIKEPEKESRTWLYGIMSQHEDLGKEVFLPVMMQVHDPMLHVDYESNFLDSLTFPEVSEKDFDYSMCKRATEESPLEDMNPAMDFIKTRFE
mmetsp:Transcript_24252/g.26921  ORF Transcript_24252/g.26921 Transcript_24252/m.26921 type:complete len:219 (-) Transcript_24252:53-709(-)